jgi:glyoxylase-like metal-dependent hydrolase (beta-lactamase superfamily II)
MRSRTIALLALLSLAAIPAAANSPGSTTADSYRRARAAVLRCAAAMGGLERLKSLDDLTVTYTGKRHLLHQSKRPDGPLDVKPTFGKIIVDLRGGRFLGDQTSEFPPKELFGYRWVLKADGGFVYDLHKNNQGSEAFTLTAEGTLVPRSTFSRMVPPTLLLAVLETPSSLRWLGVVGDGTTRSEAVAAVLPDKTQVTLYFDERTHLLSKVENIQDDPVFGDVVFTGAFSDYVEVGPIRMPKTRVEWVNDMLVRELRYEVAVDTHPADSVFQLPAGYTMPTAAATPAATTSMRRLADGVLLDTNTNHMYVEFDTFIVAVEAFADTASAAASIAAAREAVPNKPIRYVAITHAHGDHAGGLRAYIAEGVTVLTTPGNRAWVERMAASEHTIKPDVLSRKPTAPRIETFEGTREVSDGKRTLRLVDVGPSPHTEEMVVAYLPKERILYQADMFYVPVTGDIAPATGVTAWLADKVKSLGLAFDTIIDADGRVASVAEFRESLKRGGFEGAYP